MTAFGDLVDSIEKLIAALDEWELEQGSLPPAEAELRDNLRDALDEFNAELTD